MLKVLVPVVLCAALAAPMASVRAQTVGSPADPRLTDATAASPPAGAAVDARRALDRQLPAISAERSAGRTPMALEHRLGPTGAVASLGVRRVIDANRWGPPVAGLAASDHFNLPESSVGAMVSVTFR